MHHLVVPIICHIIRRAPPCVCDRVIASFVNKCAVVRKETMISSNGHYNSVSLEPVVFFLAADIELPKASFSTLSANSK